MRHARLVAAVLAAGTFLGLTILNAAPPPAPASQPGDTIVLDANSYWRAWIGWKTVQVLAADGRLGTIRDRAKNAKPRPMSASEPPPANWFAPDFDDSPWARTQGPFGINAWSQSYVDIIGPGNPGEVAMICLRGKFQAPAPVAVADLKFSIAYHGGAIVYLNGREVARSHLPAGDVTFDTLADRYPDEAYLRPDGKLLLEREAKQFPEPFARRLRTMDVTLPRDRLVKGPNVLAVAVCRAPTATAYETAPATQPPWPGPSTPWPHAKIESIRLTAAPGSRVAGQNQRPAGVRVWNRSILEATDCTDYDDPADALAPIRLAGCRNGSFSGMVMVSSDQPIANLAARCGELRSADGGVIPASACRIRYALPDGMPYQWYQAPPLTFDTLVDSAPNPVAITDKRGGAACPVWLTVGVPADARPGDYTGQLTVAAAGMPETRVEVRLNVQPFALPDPKQFTPHVGLIQSPDSVAMKYGVEMWSDRHWQLLDKSFELLGQVGNKTVYVTLLRQTHFGNQHSIVRWVRNGDRYTPDFSVVERYLDLAVKHLGKPPIVCLYLWDVYAGSTYLGTGNAKAGACGLLFTVVDPATGQLTEAEGPQWDSPETVEFLKPAVEGIRERLAKRGLEGSMMLGLSGDGRPTKAMAERIKLIAPGVKWISQAHPTLTDLYGIPCGYVTGVWNSGAPVDPQIKRHYYKPLPYIYATFPRAGSKCIGSLYTHSSPVVPRLINEATEAAAMDGFGRVGADFWNVVKDRFGYTSIVARYPKSSWAQLGLMHATTYMLGPGPDGPASTTRFELVREGVQATEARIQIERALADPARRGRLGQELADRCDKLLDSRVYAILRSGASAMAGGPRRNPYWWGFVSGGWQDRDRDLFALAAEVAAKP